MSKKKEIEIEVTDGEKESKKKTEKKPDDSLSKDKETQVQEEKTPELKEEQKAKEEILTEEEQLKNQVEELNDKLLRTAAEFDNYKKRIARQYEEIINSANDRIIIDLLEIVDNFERALKHDNNNSDLESFRKGIDLISNQFKDLLISYNVTPIEALGKPFDPNLHEAFMQVASDKYDEGLVAVEITKGYKMGNRILRHSKKCRNLPNTLDKRFLKSLLIVKMFVVEMHRHHLGKTSSDLLLGCFYILMLSLRF